MFQSFCTLTGLSHSEKGFGKLVFDFDEQSLLYVPCLTGTFAAGYTNDPRCKWGLMCLSQLPVKDVAPIQIIDNNFSDNWD